MAASLVAPLLTFLNTHSTGDTNCGNLAADVSAYKGTDLPSNPKQTEFSKMELFIKFKFNDSADPFTDPEDPLEPTDFK